VSKTTPTRTNFGSTKRVVSGDEFTCVILNDTTVWCAGLNSKGQLGHGLGEPSSLGKEVTSLCH